MKVVKRDVSKIAGQYTGSASNINISGGSGGTALADQWFYMDASTGVVHCRYNFAGDGEVSAMGNVTATNGAIWQIKQALEGITTTSTSAEIAEALMELHDIL